MAGKRSGGSKGGRGKQTSDRVSGIASKGLRNPGSLTNKEIKSISGSVLSQDETKGPRGKR